MNQCSSQTVVVFLLLGQIGELNSPGCLDLFKVILYGFYPVNQHQTYQTIILGEYCRFPFPSIVYKQIQDGVDPRILRELKLRFGSFSRFVTWIENNS